MTSVNTPRFGFRCAVVSFVLCRVFLVFLGLSRQMLRQSYSSMLRSRQPIHLPILCLLHSRRTVRSKSSKAVVKTLTEALLGFSSLLIFSEARYSFYSNIYYRDLILSRVLQKNKMLGGYFCSFYLKAFLI